MKQQTYGNLWLKLSYKNLWLRNKKTLKVLKFAGSWPQVPT